MAGPCHPAEKAANTVGGGPRSWNHMLKCLRILYKVYLHDILKGIESPWIELNVTVIWYYLHFKNDCKLWAICSHFSLHLELSSPVLSIAHSWTSSDICSSITFPVRPCLSTLLKIALHNFSVPFHTFSFPS